MGTETSAQFNKLPGDADALGHKPYLVQQSPKAWVSNRHTAESLEG